MQRHLARVRSITLRLSIGSLLTSALIVALVSSSTTAHADPKQGGATASALAQDSKPKPKPAPRSAAKTKKPAPKAAPVPKAQPVPRAIGPKAEPAPKAVEPAKEKEKDKDGNDLPDRPKDGKVDGRKWRPRARA
jgi:hypothetical protein